MRVRALMTDASMGPKAPNSTVLTPVEEAIVVEFRRRTLLPLDDVLGYLIERHVRSSGRRGGADTRALQDQRDRRRAYRRKELRHADRELILFLAIDRTSSSVRSGRESQNAPGRGRRRHTCSRCRCGIDVVV